MKKLLLPMALFLSAALLTGCVAVFGNSEGKARAGGGTLGQELVDLKKAQDTGAITPAEYETQKAKLLQKSK